MYVCASVRAPVHAPVPIYPDHNLYNNAWISKQFGTVVALEEEKCHLKVPFETFFLGKLKVKVTGVK